MKHIDKITEDNNSSQSFNSHANPITSRKTSNRLYGGYNHIQRSLGYQNNVDPLEIVSDFC